MQIGNTDIYKQFTQTKSNVITIILSCHSQMHNYSCNKNVNKVD